MYWHEKGSVSEDFVEYLCEGFFLLSLMKKCATGIIQYLYGLWIIILYVLLVRLKVFLECFHVLLDMSFF